MMPKNIARALAQFGDIGTWGVIAKAVAVTVLLFVALFWGAQWGLAQVPEFGWNWVNDAVRFLASIGLAVGLVILVIPVSAVALGFFVEELASRVETKWYGGTGRLREPGIGEMVTVMARFFLSVIVLNLVFLPFYFLPGINLAVFYVLNGLLVGREYFEMVALRHLPPKEVKRVRRRNGFTIFLAGVITTLALSIPLVNFFAPVFGAALMVHVYKGIATDGKRHAHHG
jgi:CysZ protein